MKTVIEMAREAGINHSTCEFYGEELKTLEALVRADELEACAKIGEDSEHVVSGRGYHDQLGDADKTAQNIAAAIRARGNT